MKDLEIRGAGIDPGRRAERAHRRRRLRPLRPAGRRGGDRVPSRPAPRRRRGRRGELAEVRVELPIDAHIPHDYVPASGCGWTPTARSPRRRTSRAIWTPCGTNSSTATASRRPGAQPARGGRVPAGLPGARRHRGGAWPATGMRIARSSCPNRRSCGCARLHPKAKYKAAPKRSWCRGRSRAAGSAGRRCATPRCSTGARSSCATCSPRRRCRSGVVGPTAHPLHARRPRPGVGAVSTRCAPCVSLAAEGDRGFRRFSMGGWSATGSAARRPPRVRP